MVVDKQKDMERLKQAREDRHARVQEAKRARNEVDEQAEELERFRAQVEAFRVCLAEEEKAGTGVRESLAEENTRIRVYVRKRPMNTREFESKQYDLLTPAKAPTPLNSTTSSSYAKLHVHEPRWKHDIHGERHRVLDHHTFRYDDVFDEEADNLDVYDRAVKPLVEAVTEGGRVTVFAYGQTGSVSPFFFSFPPLPSFPFPLLSFHSLTLHSPFTLSGEKPHHVW